ncbi:MAG TPA: hypothetical protein PKA29_02915 [Candidatus Saccharibacteria bacterium]|nr:hypothetical protein [Candidatus Saccharibacteria bacterium]
MKFPEHFIVKLDELAVAVVNPNNSVDDIIDDLGALGNPDSLSGFEPEDRRFVRAGIGVLDELAATLLSLEYTNEYKPAPNVLARYVLDCILGAEMAHEKSISKRLGDGTVRLGEYRPGLVEAGILHAIDDEERLGARAQLAARRAELRQD